MLNILFALILLVVSWFLTIFIALGLACRRAVAAGIVEFEYDVKIGDCGKMYRKKTPVFVDPKTKTKFYGKPEIEN